MSNIIEELEKEQMTRELPGFGPGDTVVVQVKVKEGDRERLQAFEGVVIAKRNRGLNSSFTVRKISHGEGVERVFQTYSPLVSEIRGRGLFIGVEIDPSRASARSVVEALMERGLLSKETHETVVRLAPPLVIEKRDIDWALQQIREVLADMDRVRLAS